MSNLKKLRAYRNCGLSCGVNYNNIKELNLNVFYVACGNCH